MAGWRASERPSTTTAAQPLLRTTAPRARLRAAAHRGAVGAAVIHDALPIVDLFRMVDPDALLGLMNR